MKIKTHTTRYILFSLVILLAGGSCAKSQDNSAFVPKDSSPSTSQTELQGKWTENLVSEGLVFKSFRGYDDISGAEQIVSVLDVDLNSDRYEVKFDYHDRATTSATMAKLGAVGVVNAAYESESCYIKVDGIVKFAIPNSYIMNTNVPQWKSEAAVYTDGKQDVKIDFTAKACNRDVEKTRAVYNKREEANILSSAPMLIDNYETVGANFVPDGYSQSQLEALNWNSRGYECTRTHLLLEGEFRSAVCPEYGWWRLINSLCQRLWRPGHARRELSYRRRRFRPHWRKAAFHPYIRYGYEEIDNHVAVPEFPFRDSIKTI